MDIFGSSCRRRHAGADGIPMKRLFKLALATALVTLPAYGQQATAPDYNARNITLQLANPPQPTSSATVALAAGTNPGPAMYCYWIMTATAIGNSSPAGPFCITNGPNQIGIGNNGLNVSWSAVAGATSYWVLRTTTNAVPNTQTCSCFDANIGTQAFFNDLNAATSSFALSAFDPNTVAVTLNNVALGTAAGVSGLQLAGPNALGSILQVGALMINNSVTVSPDSRGISMNIFSTQTQFNDIGASLTRTWNPASNPNSRNAVLIDTFFGCAPGAGVTVPECETQSLNFERGFAGTTGTATIGRELKLNTPVNSFVAVPNYYALDILDQSTGGTATAAIRIANGIANSIKAQNAAGTADFKLLYLDSSNNLTLGDTNIATVIIPKGSLFLNGATSGSTGITVAAAAAGTLLLPAFNAGLPGLLQCGTTTACSNASPGFTSHTVQGRVTAAASATTTVTGISPAFTSTTSYTCNVNDATATTVAEVSNASASSFTITTAAATSDTFGYTCSGN